MVSIQLTRESSFQHNSNLKAINTALPNCYLDGLVDGELKGWAQGAESVKLYLQKEFIAEVSCQRYRPDLLGQLYDARSGFFYPLQVSDIRPMWRHLDHIELLAEFLIGEDIAYRERCLIDRQQLQQALDLDSVIATLYQLDPLDPEGIFSGWCVGATHAEIFIGHQSIVTLPLEHLRLDVPKEIEVPVYGFQFYLDTFHIEPFWFNKAKLDYQVVFYNQHEQCLCADHHGQIESKKLLDSIQYCNAIPISLIAQTIGDSMLWDEAYYLRQVPHQEMIHSNKLYDYVIKGERFGRSPHAHFNTRYYLANNIDVAEDGVNAFYHYLTNGELEYRAPTPYFDPLIYQQENPDLASWELSLLSHFALNGLQEGRKHSQFSTLAKAEQHIDPYLLWRLNNENDHFAAISRDLDRFEHRPLISIVVPVYNPDRALLEACIESVIEQSYPDWQLCLADDCSSQAHVRDVLEHYAAQDKRINVVFREQNGHISAASNSALDMAIGEWTALLDHDDELHQHALYHIVKQVNLAPDTELLYSDEDKMSEDGARFDPHFKSDWNLDLLYSQNYVSHLGVYKTAIIKRIGGFRLGYEGSQDFDLLLRYSREIDHANIVHIPKVLYHWRVIEGSTASGADAKSYTTEAGIKALKDHFHALAKNVDVERGLQDNLYKVTWPVQDNPLVSLIIPTYNGHEITQQAIDSILEKSTYHNVEILLVDNNSDDPDALAYFDQLSQHEQVTVLRYPYPFNYSAINNFAAQHANGEVLGLINNDIEVISPDWLTEMVSHALREDIGCVGAKLYYPNDTIQHAGVVMGIGGVAGHSHKHFKRSAHGYFSRLQIVQNYSAVTAACLVIRKSVFDQVQGLNEEHLSVAFNDVDFCLKVKQAGYRNVWTPYAELYHHESISRGAEDNPEKVARFNTEMEYMMRTWATHQQPDPFYSPNLSLTSEDFSIIQ
ncbi:MULTISPECIES: glycosyltransferase family 2 protein [unclassified Vibrio]|uniref:Glycosyltransferase family 2 protein n=1 Tax=Vibrio sp. HB236076 TaxID=3232307 RepID=A0AB39HDK6_9VIBR|nr:glycosyltransferase family 2 protein [Vibrio sp. HB161653]MDP5254327.1 glycosyltransferase family 2 protein [Vibrio sp. HB161653]